MIRMWVECVKGTKTLKEGEKYLVELLGSQANVMRDQTNPHRRYGIVNKNKFRTIKP